MKETMNDLITMKYHNADLEKYLTKDGRYKITVDALRDAYFGSTEHTEYVITELVSVIGELMKDLELYSNKIDDQTKKLLNYSDEIITAYLQIVQENFRHEQYLQKKQ